MKEMKETFEAIAKPHKTMEKQISIMNILKDLNPEFIDGMGILIRGTDGDNPIKKVIVSHFDLVRPFEKGFAEGKTIIMEDEVIYGALDNTITNSVLINELLTNGLPDDTIILFTDGEESGMWGMSKFMVDEADENMFFINLDVTNDNWDYGVSIEYDRPNNNICLDIDASMNAGFTTDRFADDLSAVMRHNGKGFSYCIPTRKSCHTYNSNTTIKHLKAYEKGLTFLVQNLNVEECEPDGTRFFNNKL